MWMMLIFRWHFFFCYYFHLTVLLKATATMRASATLIGKTETESEVNFIMHKTKKNYD